MNPLSPLLGVIATKLFDMLEEQFKTKVVPFLLEQLTALIPVVVAAATKVVTEQVFERLPGIDLPDLPNVPDLANSVLGELNKIVPDLDIGIPAIDNLLDAWRPKA